MKAKAALSTLTGYIEAHAKQMAALGDEVRRTIIKPLCKKHNLKFYSGNGDYYFKIPGEKYPADHIGTRLDAEEAGMFYLVEVFDLLDEEIGHGFPFGFYVDSVL